MTEADSRLDRRDVSTEPYTNAAPLRTLRDRVSRPDAGTSLEDLVYERLRAYADNLQGHNPSDMYRLIMPQLERPLIRVALEMADGEKQRAAQMLGIHRNTLRTRLRHLGIEVPRSSSKPR